MTKEAFSDDKISNVLNVLNVVTNEEDAISYLLKEGGFADKDEPDPVLLHLNLPRRNGHEVLREMEGDPQLRRIPIVVLTTSDAEEDVLASYDLHANAFVRKPVDFEQFVAAIRAIDDFFISGSPVVPVGRS